MQSFFKKINKLNKAFTLVETLVAISIFSVSILGIMSVLGSGIAHTNYAKRKAVAIYLAQEGIEYVRNIRDTEILYGSGNSWAQFKSDFSSCNNENNACGLVMPPFNVSPNCSNGCKLYINNGGYDTNSNGADSGFTRKIWMVPIGSGNDEVKIFSKVEWTQGSGIKSVTFSENLFNWYEI